MPHITNVIDLYILILVSSGDLSLDDRVPFQNFDFLLSVNGIQLLYRPSNVQCDWPERVECGSRPACDENDDNCHDNHATTPKPTVCEGIPCDHGDGFYPEGDCDQCFCRCVGGAHFETCCSPGLVFNPAKNQCDWTWNVNGC